MSFTELGPALRADFDPDEPRDEKGEWTSGGGHITETPQFQTWFKDSKVLDPHGKPLVLYHSGTFDESYDAVPKIGDQGMHFGTKQAARDRAYGKRKEDANNSLKVEKDETNGRWYWNIESENVDSGDTNDEGFDDYTDADADAMDYIRDLGDNDDYAEPEEPELTKVYLSIKNPKRVADPKYDWKNKIAQAKSEGYDGIVYKNAIEDAGSDSYIVFSPQQVKSVNNKGTFDPAAQAITDAALARLDEFNPNEPRDESGKWTGSGGSRMQEKAGALFKRFEDAPTNEGIEAAEENWRGGVADLGDPQAAIDVQNMQGYFDYRSHLEEAADEILGSKFDVYRSMPMSQLQAWKNGEDLGPIGTTLNEGLAHKWQGLAAHKEGDDQVVARIEAAPGAIVMRGHEGESELVIDPNSLDAHSVRVMQRPVPKVSKEVEAKRDAAFDELAQAQRDKPEWAMLRATEKLGGGVMSPLLEHIGDLTHRMSEHGGRIALDQVNPKVEKGLRYLKSGYGFEREHRENMASNKVDPKVERDLREAYAQEHEKLPVYNDMQYAGREAAIAIARGRYDDAIGHLKTIKRAIDNGTFNMKNMAFDPDYAKKRADASARADSYDDVWDEALADYRADSQPIRELQFAHDAYNPNEARIPKGQPGAGQWTSGGGGMGFTKDDKVSNDSIDVWHHAAGTLRVQKATGKWKFINKSNGKEYSGDDEESLNKFVNDNRMIFKPPKLAGDPAKEGPDIVDAIKTLAGGGLTQHPGDKTWQTYETHDFMFHVNPATGEYMWKPPASPEAVKGTGLHEFLDDMQNTTAFADQAKEMLDALPKPPTTWAPHPAALVLDKGDWNRQNSEKLEKEFVAAAPELDAMVDKLYQDKTPVEGEEEETGKPESWDELTGEQQEEAEQKWMSNNESDFYDSEVSSWYDSGQPLHMAKEDLANEGTDAPYVEETIQEFLDDWAGDPDDPEPVPYTLEHLMAATTIKEYHDKYDDGQSDPEWEFDDEELKKPTDLVYDPDKQGVLPGIPPAHLSAHFTQAMRDDLESRLTKAFNDQAEKNASNMDAPDYLSESNKESMGDYWDQMDDETKFAQAEASMDFDEITKSGSVKVLDHPPRKYDPFNFHPGTDDYKRTQNISHALSLERAVDVLTKRGLIKGPKAMPTTESVVKQFHEAQAHWDDGPTAKQLEQMLVDDAKPEEVAKVHPHMAELLQYSYDMLYSGPVENVFHGGDWTKAKTLTGDDINKAEAESKQFAVKLVHAADLTGKQVAFKKDIIDKELTPQEKEVFDKYEHKLTVDMAATLSRRVQTMQGQTTDPQVMKDAVRKIDSDMWREWVGSSTSFGGKMIQIGASDEFGGFLRLPKAPKLEPEPIKEMTDAEVVADYGKPNNTGNADLHQAILHHLAGLIRDPKILRKLPHDASSAMTLPGVVDQHMKLGADKDGNVWVSFDTDAMSSEEVAAVKAIRPELEATIKKGIAQRREDFNAQRREDKEIDAKMKYGGYKPISEDLAVEDMQALPSPNQMRVAFEKALELVGPTDPNERVRLSKRMAVNNFWRSALTKKDDKWVFDPAKLDIAGVAIDTTFPNETKWKDMLDTPQAREEVAKAARGGFEDYMKWRNSNLKKDAIKVYDDVVKEAWEPKEELIKQADQRYAQIGGYAGVKALMRAKWETTQWLMAKAGINEFSAYRGILDPQVNGDDIEKVMVHGNDGNDYVKLPGYTMLRNGAASTALKASVSNNWHSWRGGDKDRVVLRIRMPRTAALSVPSYGQNEAAEREVIVTGTAWKDWDAYKTKAPEFDVIPIEHHAVEPTGEATATSEPSQFDHMKAKEAA